MIILITGASSGFGLETACLLISSGHRVFGTHLPHEQVGDLPFELLPLDVTDPDSVAACVAAVLERAGRIDVLVNNAGVQLLGALEEVSIEEAQRLFDVNFFGMARMTSAVLPTLRAQRSGKIINISSLAGLIGSPFQGFYAASKHAVEGYSESLRYEVRPFNIHVALIEPGISRTNLGRNTRVAARSIDAYRTVQERVNRTWHDYVHTGTEPQHVARTILKIVEAPRPHLRYLVGPDAWRGALAKRFAPFEVLEQGVRWELKADDVGADVQRGLPWITAAMLLLVGLLRLKRR